MGLAGKAEVGSRQRASLLSKTDGFVDRAIALFEKLQDLRGHCEMLAKKAIIARMRGDLKLAEVGAVARVVYEGTGCCVRLDDEYLRGELEDLESWPPRADLGVLHVCQHRTIRRLHLHVRKASEGSKRLQMLEAQCCDSTTSGCVEMAQIVVWDVAAEGLHERR